MDSIFRCSVDPVVAGITRRTQPPRSYCRENSFHATLERSLASVSVSRELDNRTQGSRTALSSLTENAAVPQRVTMYLDAGQPLGNALPGCHDRTSFAMSAKVVKNESSLALARRDQRAYGP
jgi:hypothetical protein